MTRVRRSASPSSTSTTTATTTCRPQGLAAARRVPQRSRVALPAEPGIPGVRGRGVRRRASAADLHANGQVELYTTGLRGLERWTPDAAGVGARSRWPATARLARRALAVADVDGDGALDLRRPRSGPELGRVSTYRRRAAGPAPSSTPASPRRDGWTVAYLDPARGPSVIGASMRGLPEWKPGPGRPPYVALGVSGPRPRERSAALERLGHRHAPGRPGGIALDGVRRHVAPAVRSRPEPAALRRRPRRAPPAPTSCRSPGPTASCRPRWCSTPDACTSSRRRSGSSRAARCSSRSTARRFAFVTDILGVGGIGFLERPGRLRAAAPARARAAARRRICAARDGRYALVIGEPMEEVAYLDARALVAYDLPPGWRMTLDERKAIAGPAPRAHRSSIAKSGAARGSSTTVAADVTSRGRRRRPARRPARPRRSRASSAARHAHTLDAQFDRAARPRPRRAGADRSTAGSSIPTRRRCSPRGRRARRIARPRSRRATRDGRWHIVAPTSSAIPPACRDECRCRSPGSRPDTTALRLSTTQEIYWDRLAVVYAEPAPSVRGASCSAQLGRAARLRLSPRARPGPSGRRTTTTTGARRSATRATRAAGTRASVRSTPLVAARRRRGGDLRPRRGRRAGIRRRLPTPSAVGWTRRVVLDADGWCKDMDLYTQGRRHGGAAAWHDRPPRRRCTRRSTPATRTGR